MTTKQDPRQWLEQAACAGCDVRLPCLQYAMSFKGEIAGIYGGLSEMERRRLRQQLGGAKVTELPPVEPRRYRNQHSPKVA